MSVSTNKIKLFLSVIRWKSYPETDDWPHEPLLAIENDDDDDDRKALGLVRAMFRKLCHLVGWGGHAHGPASPDQLVQQHSARYLSFYAYQIACEQAQHLV